MEFFIASIISIALSRPTPGGPPSAFGHVENIVITTPVFGEI